MPEHRTTKNSEARIKANNKYNDKAYDRINIAVPKGTKEVIQAAAEQCGESINGFIKRLIFDELNRLERDQHNAGDNYGNSAPDNSAI